MTFHLIPLNCRYVKNLILIDEVEKFSYINSCISHDGGAETDVFRMQNRILKASNICRNLKLKIFKSNSLFLTVVKVFVNKCLKRIHKIYWQNTIRIAYIWEITKSENLDVMNKLRTWNWISRLKTLPIINFLGIH